MKISKSGIISIFLFITTVCFAEDLILTGNLVSGWHYINGSISTQGTTVINSGVDLELIAQTRVSLKPGFKVFTGGALKAAVSPDTDGDLILDMVEQRSGCLNFQLSDTDNDSLTDSAEDVNHNGIHEPALKETSACNNDTDGDKIPDGWEVTNGLNPVADNAGDDPDKDKLTNYMEYYFKVSDPLDGNSLPPKGSYYEYDELGRIIKIIRIK